MKTTYKGIDYGRGLTNIDHETGIRFGVIDQSEVGQIWFNKSEPEYDEPRCPKCGNEVTYLPDFESLQIRNKSGRLIKLITPDDVDQFDFNEHECADYFCHECEYVFGSESAYCDGPMGFCFVDDEYKCFQSQDDTDIFIEKSPYFTYAQFCSPCAPGAVFLMNYLSDIDTSKIGPNDLNNRGYCFGHDWWESGKAPYRVFSVETGEEVLPKRK